MDPLTQGLTGAVLAQAVAKPEKVHVATLMGIAGGMLADVDVLIRSSEDPMLFFEFHRHFTHSLVFIPIGGLITIALFWCLPWIRRRVTFREGYLYTTAAYATSGLLDACTSYGTQLLWPFSDARIAWNIIAIIDPVYTLGLLIAVILTAIRHRPKVARWGVIFGLAYLTLGTLQHYRAEAMIQNIASSRGHESVKELSAKPAPFSLLLWRGIYRHEENYHVCAVHVSLPGYSRIYPGGSVPKLDVTEAFPELPRDSTTYRDLIRFQHFSNDYLFLHPKDPLVVGDLRYALLPNQLTPLWGIRIRLKNPEQHVSFENFRNIQEDDWKDFRNMLLGKPLK